MTGDSETRTYLVGLEQYWAAGERGENDGSSPPPRPQNRDVAWEVATFISKSIAALLDFQETGVLPDIDTEPSPESRLAAAELIAQYTNRTN